MGDWRADGWYASERNSIESGRDNERERTRDIIDRRRSVRSYQNREIEPEKIEKLLRAALQTPSAGTA